MFLGFTLLYKTFSPLSLSCALLDKLCFLFNGKWGLSFHFPWLLQKWNHFPLPNSSLSSLSFPKKFHFPICCSMSNDERLVAMKKNEAERFYNKEKLDLLSSEEKKKLVTSWINDNMVVEDEDKYKKVKNKMMMKKKPGDLDEIEFGDILEKGEGDLITLIFLIVFIHLLLLLLCFFHFLFIFSAQFSPKSYWFPSDFLDEHELCERKHVWSL